MFSRAVVAFCFLIPLSVPAAAKPWNNTPPVSTTATATVTVTVSAPAPAPTSGDTCSTGPVQCCNTVGSANEPPFSGILGLLGIVVEGAESMLGLGCSPMSVDDDGSGTGCSFNVVCCQNNNVGGLSSIGCMPIIL
ncbi:fungal hydrophobin [Dichomitus squalens]|uniref:Hydrophobin n=1 Tax=Dichomitus squalens TaxID=114155 RepID=A0A4Q9MGE7_9APHY|nr:fungal hydrophobin [Dichomitus squalens]